MPQVGFEPTIQVFERAKKIHVLDRVAAVIGQQECMGTTNCLISFDARRTAQKTKNYWGHTAS
jgi:hypothetical protein